MAHCPGSNRLLPRGRRPAGDQGTLDTVRVLDTRERGDAIVHITDGPLTPGTSVTGELDWALRFARMQCHSGEHVLSGLAHSLYGCTNVGFHMGEDQVILDFDKELTPQQLTVLEDRANQLITENRPGHRPLSHPGGAGGSGLPEQAGPDRAGPHRHHCRL